MFDARLYGVVGVAARIVKEVLFRILPGHLLCKEGMQSGLVFQLFSLTRLFTTSFPSVRRHAALCWSVIG